MKDPFYRQIFEALEGPLDPQVFESCMGDLLRQDLPGLVPVSGGGDSGFDGLIPGREGAFPLVCTTAKDIEANLRGSLRSVRKRGWPGTQAVFATSRKLTPQRQLKLFELAESEGFRLIQVFERTALADRLYRNGRWAKELLGLSGAPGALSMIPATRRPLLPLEPVGREPDLEWLRALSSDAVLTGEPGSGKTFLLHYLMRQGWPGLFLVQADFDGGSLANAIRELKPGIVVVDDAHEEPSHLERLARLRAEFKADFQILATTWRGSQDQVVAALGIPSTRVRRLELLTRDEILNVIRQVGVRGGDDLLRDLVSQASNKPGLAVTIASLWLQGSWQEVVEGTALSRTLTTFFERYLGPDSIDVLACFALGGEAGMDLEVVREYLQLNRPTIRQIGVGLDAGGVLSESGRNVLAVWPEKLRFSLLRTVFFPGTSARLDYRDLLERAPNIARTVETLVAAKHHGAEIPKQELRDLVFRAGSRRAWEWLAALDVDEAVWVLDHYPRRVADIADAALRNAEGATLKRLLDQAIPASRSAEFDVLGKWVRELQAPTLHRRRTLIASAKEYFRAGGDREVAVWAICLALSPSLESTSRDPGLGRSLTITWGSLSPAAISQMHEVWAAARELLSEVDELTWKYLKPVLADWAYARVPEGAQAAEIRKAMQAFAAEVLRDLASSARGKPGLVAGLGDLAKKIGVVLDLEQDPIFEVLFPAHDYTLSTREQREANRYAALGDLARQWADRDPQEVATELGRYEAEARAIGRTWPRGGLELCRAIAKSTTSPEGWLQAFLHSETPEYLAGPFLEKLVEIRHERCEYWLADCLQRDGLVWQAADLVLQLSDPPKLLLEKALDFFLQFPQLLETLCLTRQVPLTTLNQLLNDSRGELALAAAVGEWNAGEEKGPRPEVLQAWRQAILMAPDDKDLDGRPDQDVQFWLGEILASDAELALEWMRERLRQLSLSWHVYEERPMTKAVLALRREQKSLLLEDLTDDHVVSGLVTLLVGRDPEMYREVLDRKDLAGLHLAPLAGMPDDAWLGCALVALNFGYSSRDIAEAALWVAGSYVGSGVEHWSRWAEVFARLEEDPRELVQEIGRHGRLLAEGKLQSARQEERKQAIRGF